METETAASVRISRIRLVAALALAVLAAGLGAAPPALAIEEAPTNITPPTITGTEQQGHTLTEHHGSWTNNPSPTGYTYQWLRCSSGSCTPIEHATSQTYELVEADVGDTIAVRETASNTGGTSSPATSTETAGVLPAPPVSTSPPTITGTEQQGQTLTEHHGSWTNNPSPTGYTYQWLQCSSTGTSCTTIAGATHETYVPEEVDVGHTIKVEETASNAGGSGVPATSSATPIIKPAAPFSTGQPTITGTAQQGQTLTEVHGTWEHTPTSYAYQWLQCSSTGTSCTTIAGATHETYVPEEVDVGHTIVVQETASNAGGSGGPAPSSPTAVIVAPPPSTPPSNPGTGQAAPPVTTVSTPSPPLPPTKVKLALIANVHERLIHGTTLEVSFRLTVKARVRMIARRGRKVVARTTFRTLAAGNHRLLLVLSRRHWPTKLELQSRALAPLVTISQ